MPTVAAEVALGTGQQGLSGAALVERVLSALRRMRMEEFAEVATATLSGGQKQRLAIATALAQGPPAPKVLMHASRAPCCWCPRSMLAAHSA